MQGLGNKFVVLSGPLDLSAAEVIAYCKQFGDEPADGVLVVSPLTEHSVKMKYWNADGTLAEMCGNGLRCVVRFAIDSKMVQPGELIVKTDAGDLKGIWDGNNPSQIEVQVGKANVSTTPLELFGKQFFEVNVGNPHAVTFVDDLDTAPVKTLGPEVENNSRFPHRTNVEFVVVEGNNEISLRTWERGVGETLACGTGMVAAANVAVTLKNKTFPLIVNVLGGKAKVWLDEAGYTRMIGPAELV